MCCYTPARVITWCVIKCTSKSVLPALSLHLPLPLSLLLSTALSIPRCLSRPYPSLVPFFVPSLVPFFVPSLVPPLVPSLVPSLVSSLVTFLFPTLVPVPDRVEAGTEGFFFLANSKKSQTKFYSNCFRSVWSTRKTGWEQTHIDPFFLIPGFPPLRSPTKNVNMD